MKKYLQYLLFCAFIVLVGTSTTACSRKSGCPYNEYTDDKDKKLSTKKGKSNLFPKHMRKKRRN